MTIVLLTTLEEDSALVLALKGTGLVSSVIATHEASEVLCDADVVMVNWPYILKKEFIDRQRVVLNVHNSLLPRYRGRHAFTWAILHGEKELGFSLHLVVSAIDAGDVLSQTSFPLADDEDVMDAFRHGEKALLEWLPSALIAWVDGALRSMAQDSVEASYFHRRDDEDNWLPSFDRAADVLNFVRAVAPPYTAGAKCRTIHGETLRIAAASYVDEAVAGISPGTIVACDADALIIACADRALRLRLANSDALGFLRTDECLLAGGC